MEKNTHESLKLPTEPPAEKKTSKKIWLIIGGGIGFLIIIVVVLFFVGPKLNLQNSSPDQESLPPKEVSLSGVPTPDSSQTVAFDKTLTFENLAFDSAGLLDIGGHDPRGPFYHQVATAYSSDGLNFTKEEGIILDKASVPDAVRLESGRILAYAVDGLPERSQSGFLVAFSDDDGKTWKAGSLRVETDRTKFVVGGDPEIVLLPDGSFRLYYITSESPAGAGIDPNAVNKIRSAVSQDGLNFTEEEGVRFEGVSITDPDVVKIGETWFMYLSEGQKLTATSSTDGLNFTLGETVREKGSVSNTVPIENGEYRQYFCNGGIQSATTSDGLDWETEAEHRLLPEAGDSICDPVPVELDDQWLLLYKISPVK